MSAMQEQGLESRAKIAGELWARRMFAELARGRSVAGAWPGRIQEAQLIAESLTLDETAAAELATVIQGHAVAAWSEQARVSAA